MIQQSTGKFSYTLDTITRKAPVTSGVYSLFSRGECLYVGESEDICASLLLHYYEDNPCLNDKEITHFTFDLASSETRRALLNDRIQQHGPTCHPGTGPSRVSRYPSAQGPALHAPLAMAEVSRF